MDKEFKFKSCTGKDVYARMWINENIKEYKAVIQLVHGMQEHIGRYDVLQMFLLNVVIL